MQVMIRFPNEYVNVNELDTYQPLVTLAENKSEDRT